MVAINPTKEFPLFRIREDATAERLGYFEALPGEAFRPHFTAERTHLARCPVGDTFAGLPWYLEDLRPQGFLGRLYAQRHPHLPSLDLPTDPSPSKALLKQLMLTGGTGMGDLIPGEPALYAALSALHCPPDHVHDVDRSYAYPERVHRLITGGATAPGPGGEQAKFTATVTGDGPRRAVLVKFAHAGEGAAAERWADLLICEHLALQCLRDAGVAAARSQLIQSQGYTFLEVERFDRTPEVLGRRGFVSLLSLSAAFAGEAAQDWGTAGARLQALGWITPDTVQRMEQLHAFGRLIANSHMHPGNLGFHLRDHGPLGLAPVYDMLPTSLAPCRSGGLPALAPIPPMRPACGGGSAALRWAAPLAMDYWNRVAASGLLCSKALRAMAKRNTWRLEMIIRASA